MDAQKFLRIFGYCTSGFVGLAGLVIICGVFPSYVPENFRIIVGILLMLYGLYRATMLMVRHRIAKRNEHEVS